MKIGDRVFIRPDSKYYGKSKIDPKDVVGFVTRVSDTCVDVKWSTGYVNYYSHHDLHKAVVNNALNKKLYPNWIECKDYLVPEILDEV